MFALVARNYPDRMDDLRLQFLLAQVAAGLAFLHKIPREGNSSGGLSASQYRQSFIWAASFLNQFLDSLSISIESLFPTETKVPVLGKAVPTDGITPTSLEWQKVKYFDADGFNILVIPNSREPVPEEISALPWSLVLDFREHPPSEEETQLSGRLFRQSWPGQELPDFRLFARGGLWYFANGRSDISGAEPSPTPSEWRRRYRRSLDDLLMGISETASPVRVRALVLAGAFVFDQIRLVAESLDTAFSEALAPVVVVSDATEARQLDGIPVIRSSVDAAVIALDGARAAAPLPDTDVARLPRRQGTAVALAEIPPNVLARVGRDLTILYRARAQTFPSGRVFGRDFRRGMPIEWAELAQNLDVPRKAAFAHYFDQVEEGLKASSNRTVNLLHEPSAGGTTLGRRLAWEFMERYPVVLLDQLSSDTASYLRDIFQFSSLPVLVLMESVAVTESEREGLLRQLREDNTRAVFLWVSRAYGYREDKEILPGRLDDLEVALFRDAYLDQLIDDSRRKAIQWLSSSAELQDQRNPFFFGLTAFGENFLGADRLVQDVIDRATEPTARSLLTDLCLVSLYSNDGFPIFDYDELCVRFNDSKWPAERDSLFLLTTATHVRVSHTLLAEKALVALARNGGQWRVDLSLFSSTLLAHLASLNHRVSDRIETIVQTLFITRDIESAIEADNDIQAGGIATQRRFSPLINDLGNVAQARTIFRRVVQLWPKEPHYAAHLARHLLYEEPKEIEEAVTIASAVERVARDDGDAALVHVAGMAYRVRMEQRLRETRNEGKSLQSIESSTRSDFETAVDAFARATAMKPGNEYGLVATIQTVGTLLRFSSELANATDLGQFLRQPSRGWYLDALALAEESIDELKHRPQTSIRARRAIAEWDLVYGKIDKVIGDLRMLASRYEDTAVRRALCSAIIARAKHNWNSISQGDLQTVALMMERNINQQGVRSSVA
jgi:tetratricopeptide (TPR) repeat protein